MSFGPRRFSGYGATWGGWDGWGYPWPYPCYPYDPACYDQAHVGKGGGGGAGHQDPQRAAEQCFQYDDEGNCTARLLTPKVGVMDAHALVSGSTPMVCGQTRGKVYSHTLAQPIPVDVALVLEGHELTISIGLGGQCYQGTADLTEILQTVAAYAGPTTSSSTPGACRWSAA
jgi:hypothetical protein